MGGARRDRFGRPARRAVGLGDFADEEMDEAVRRSTGDFRRLYALSAAYAQDARHFQSLRILRRYFIGLARSAPPALPRAFWDSFYPLGWRTELTDAASRAENVRRVAQSIQMMSRGSSASVWSIAASVAGRNWTVTTRPVLCWTRFITGRRVDARKRSRSPSLRSVSYAARNSADHQALRRSCLPWNRPGRSSAAAKRRWISSRLQASGARHRARLTEPEAWSLS